MSVLDLDRPRNTSSFLGVRGLIGGLMQRGIHAGLRLSGRRVAKRNAAWLDSPLGPAGITGEKLYAWLAEREQLELRVGRRGAGLLEDFGALAGPRFDPKRVRPEIKHFYEHTTAYQLETWGEVALLPRFFLWGLVTFVSRRMNQLNFPLCPLDLCRGMSSDVVELFDPCTGRRVHTGWLRKVNATGSVIYAGLYTTGQPGRFDNPCVKVMFPMPRGCSTVFLRPENQPDGSFKLISSGEQFGDAGFYRMVERDDKHWTVRYLRSLKELFHVYVDDEGVLRTDHTVRFLGCEVLRLHYKLVRK
jgi:hypothetical protein